MKTIVGFDQTNHQSPYFRDYKMNKLITEAIADANAVQSVAEERAKEMLIKEFSPKIKSMLASVINESDTVSTGADQPGGYSPEEDQDAIGADTSTSAEDINKKGAGPDNLAEEDELDVDAEEEPVMEAEDEEEEEDEAIHGKKGPKVEGYEEDEEEEDEAVDMTAGAPEDGEEDDVLEIVDEPDGDEAVPGEEVPPVDEDDAIPPAGDEEDMTPDQVMEAYKKVRKIARKLHRENKALHETVNVLGKKFRKIDLFNAKLAYAFKLMTQPGLSRTTKKQIAETFDAAHSVRETKLIYKTLKNSLNTAIRTQKRPMGNKNVRSVISESTKQPSGMNRMSELAGI